MLIREIKELALVLFGHSHTYSFHPVSSCCVYILHKDIRKELIISTNLDRKQVTTSSIEDGA